MSPVLYNRDRELVSDDVHRVNALNEAFAAEFTNPDVNSPPHATSYPIDIMSDINVTESAVRAALAMVSPTKMWNG